jgi:hypothetical protein
MYIEDNTNMLINVDIKSCIGASFSYSVCWLDETVVVPKRVNCNCSN